MQLHICYNDHVLIDDFSWSSSTLLYITCSQYGSKMWHWFGLAWLYSIVCARTSANLELFVITILTTCKTCRVNGNLSLLNLLLSFRGIDFLRRVSLCRIDFWNRLAIEPRHRTPRFCKTRGKRSSLCIVKEKGHGKGYILW